MADVTKTVKDAAYVTVGLGVLAFQKAQVARRDLTKQVETQLNQTTGQVKDLSKKVEGRIQPVLGQLEQTVPALLRHAAAVAYPSLDEGFGLPALEALACGAPLVTTEGTAMAEVTGDAALLVSPGNADAVAQALEALVAGGAEVDRLRKLGPDVASTYTWERSAAAHAGVYRSLVP